MGVVEAVVGEHDGYAGEDIHDGDDSGGCCSEEIERGEEEMELVFIRKGEGDHMKPSRCPVARPCHASTGNGRSRPRVR